MKERKRLLFFVTLCCFFYIFFFYSPVNAKVTSEQKKEYVDVLSQLIKEGTESKKLDVYADVARGNTGKKAFRQAALQNRAALMAEGIDFLDGSWVNYYTVETKKGRTKFNSTKMISRKVYRRRYKEIMEGLEEVLSCIEAGMTDADKAMAVYYYLAKNTTYANTKDCHTGYDVLVNHTGVCDGFANAYALVLNTLGIRCAVVSNYSKDHSWNLVEIDKKWYFCDLTNGIGTGNQEGLVVSYSSCLVSMSSFLTSHSGYTVNDAYGEANSDELNVKKLPLAQTDYIPLRSSIRTGISAKTCLFYHQGYWYWVSTGNMLKKSKLDGSEEETVYIPADDKQIGWAEEFNEVILISLNDTIYRMNYNGRLKEQLWQVMRSEYKYAVSSYFWQLASVGRFYRNSDNTVGYYITDLSGAKKGTGNISVAHIGKTFGKPKLSAQKIEIRAGYEKQLYVIQTTPAGSRQLQWKSSNPSVAEVDQYGCVTAKKKGTAVITAVIDNKQMKCTVKVSGYTITYKKAGINAAGNPSTASGKKSIKLKEAKKEGYSFEGWYTDKKRQNVIMEISKGNSKNYTVYAKWEKKE